MMKKIGLVSFLIVHFISRAQDSSLAKSFSVHFYAEVYYGYDFSKPANHERPNFFYSFRTAEEANLNLGLIKATYHDELVRGNLALMAGTYAQFNMINEPTLLQSIYEANVGVKMSKKHNLWLDAGVLNSHIGSESAIGKDCWTLSRSIGAENIPYYESGIKLGYHSKNEKLYVAGMYLNGWQRIQRIPYNQTPAFGTQFLIKPNSKINVNWSTFVGNEFPDSVRKWRVFNDFYTHMVVTKKLALLAGFDIGFQQQKKDTNAFFQWNSPVLIVKYQLSKKTHIAARAEYYSDPHQVMIVTGTKNGFQTAGYSINFDYFPTEKVIMRIEGRALQSKDDIFSLNKKPSQMNYCIMTSMAISF